MCMTTCLRHLRWHTCCSPLQRFTLSIRIHVDLPLKIEIKKYFWTVKMMDEEPLRRFNANNDKAVDRQIVFNFFFLNLIVSE